MWRKTAGLYGDLQAFRRTDAGRLMYWLRDNVHYMSLAGGGDGRIKLPNDYQYRDGDPGEWVGGKTHFGKRIRSSAKRDAGDSRQKFAAWMTTENDNFDYVIVNRMWERVMGAPITHPVDEYVEDDKTIAPGLVR